MPRTAVKIGAVVAWVVTTLACGPPGDLGPTDAGRADDAGPMPPSVPWIQDALDCPVTGEYRLPTGSGLHRVTLTDPNAVCNDGTPALLFVRAATDPAQADRWIFHLQGGGSCAEHDCADRWCGSASTMSSMNAPAAVDASGIFSPENANAFRGANQVYVTYCSSDNHAGTSGEVVIPANEDHVAFRVHFEGEAIVQAAASAIESGVTSDDGEETLSPLAPGDTVFLTGTSAGCTGLAHQADRLTARWARRGASTRAICDAAFLPSAEDFASPMAQEAAVRLETELALNYETRMRTQALLLDESCVAAERAEPFRCATASHVLAEHVTEPRLFISQDNNDSLFISRIVESTEGVATPQQVASFLGPAIRTALARAADGTGGTQISVYGRTCGHHVSLTSNANFLVHSVATSDGPLTYHDALVGWLSGETVVVIDSEDSPSTCN